MTPGLRVWAMVLSVSAACFVARQGRAEDAPDALFATAVQLLEDGRANEAIASFEALADRGVVDPVASYDRALAYAARIREGAEVPGDLGRAAHGFEEARELTTDAQLVADAARALEVVRSEVARRRSRAGQSVEVDYGRSLGRAVANLVPEDVWAALSALTSAALALGLFVRWLSRAPKLRAGGGVAAGTAAPALAIAVAMTLASRHDRRELREAVVVSAEARPLDGRGLVVPGATPLPEGARVEIVDATGPSVRVRFGASDVRVASATLRELARHD